MCQAAIRSLLTSLALCGDTQAYGPGQRARGEFLQPQIGATRGVGEALGQAELHDALFGVDN